jgi:cell wall assembly regulator SMI1
MGHSVAESWDSIVNWLREHLPHALDHLQPPATQSEISTLSSAMNRRLPGDLIAWLRLNNGFGWQANFGSLLPVLYVPMEIDRMLRRREMMQRIWASIAPDRPSAAEQAPAGTSAFEWLDAFLPIGDAGTDCELVVDLRDGEHFGCVTNYDAQSGGADLPGWFSITEMLNDVADALTLGQPALQDHGRRYHASGAFPNKPPRAWSPGITENRLWWDLVDLVE